ncbi:hypothetical protein GCM10009839_25530 [Catenulispora yoronensis]|uniref:Uncharacterized protein n=1 Tax=Catenulispora yoronensis TaxID=450799 RepID=A0ABN2U123_9ACTN
MYENSRSGAARAGALGPSSTPVFDALMSEFRANFRTVPGEPWSPSPVPRFAGMSVSTSQFGLPPGHGGL